MRYNMKKIIPVIFFMLVLSINCFAVYGPQQLTDKVASDGDDYFEDLSGWYTQEYSYFTPDNQETRKETSSLISSFFDVNFNEIVFDSTFTFYGNVESKSDGCENCYYLSFGLDVNNPKFNYNDNAFIINEDYEFTNYIRSDTYELEKILDRSVSSSDVTDNDYFGLPFTIENCYVDCDSDDTIAPARWYMSNDELSKDIWYMNIKYASVSDSSWLDLVFPENNLFYDTKNVYRFQKTDYKCDYSLEPTGKKEMKFGCVIKKNPLYRQNSIYGDEWAFNDILDSVAITNVDQDTAVIKFSNVLDLDGNNVSSVSITTTDESFSESYSPPEESATVERMLESKIQEEQILNEYEWQNIILSICSYIVMFFIVIFYILQLAVAIYVLFGFIPLTLKMFKTKLDEMVNT